MFANPVDIANRALQHCGAARIDPTLGFTEDTVNASECGFAYEKLRTAELRRSYWRFATRFAVLRPLQTDPTQLPHMLLLAPLYSSFVSYEYGSLCSDALGIIWESQQPANVGNAPGNSPYWELYSGPLAIPAWDTTGGTGYYLGDVVYTTAGDGTALVYKSLVESNTAVPNTVEAWAATTYYKKDDVVSQLGVNYQSLIDFNLAQIPSAATAPPAWNAATAYSAAQGVRGSNGFMYTSIAGGNLNNNPVFSTGFWTATGVLAPWTTTLTTSATSRNWLDLGCTLTQLRLQVQGGQCARYAFRLPANYLRTPNQEPKAGSASFLGAPSGLAYTDWEYNGDFIYTRNPYPIVLRFIADISNVLEMDGLFCEALAARLAHAIAPRVTQSANKTADIAKVYLKFMNEARMVNAVDDGATEPPEDDLISCRI